MSTKTLTTPILCNWNADLMKGMSRSLQKYLSENPSCKNSPEYEGYCLEHLPYEIKLQYEYEQTTVEQRQQYLDLINKGKSIGDSYKEVGISFEAALAITNKGIRAYHFLEKDASKL